MISEFEMPGYDGTVATGTPGWHADVPPVEFRSCAAGATHNFADSHTRSILFALLVGVGV